MTTLTVTADSSGFLVGLRASDPDDFRACLAALKDFIAPAARRYDRDARKWVVDGRSAAALHAWAHYCRRSRYASVEWEGETAGEWDEPRPRARRAEPRDAYAALHLLPDAPPELVKVAYRCLSLRHHPDRGGTHEKMVEINRAFETLGGRLAA